MKNNNAFLQGSQSNHFNLQDHSAFIFEVDRCKDFEGKDKLDYPECASDPDIDSYLQGKKGLFQILDQRLDKSSQNSFQIRYKVYAVQSFHLLFIF